MKSIIRKFLSLSLAVVLAAAPLNAFASDALGDDLTSSSVEVNERTENIGARRLHTLLEKIVEDISFTAPDHKGETFVIDAAYVDERLKGLVADEDLSRYIL